MFDSARRRFAFLGTHRTAILGRGAQLLVAGHLGWRGGFVDELRVQPSRRASTAAFADLLGHPTCRFVRHVAIGELRQVEDAIAVLADAAPPLLETCLVVDSETPRAAVDADPLTDVTTLRKLSLANAIVTRPMPQLRELVVTIRGPNLIFDWITAGGCPEVEELTLLYMWPRGLRPQQIAEIVRALPKLRRLRAIGASDGDGLVAALGVVPNQLELLDLSHCALGDAGRSALAAWPRPPNLVDLATSPRLPVYELHDPKPTTYLTARLAAEGRGALRDLPGVGGPLYRLGAELIVAKTSDAPLAIPYLDASATLPSSSLGTYQWANAAIAHELAHHLDEAELRAREALLHVPGEPTFHAILIDALRRTDRLDEAGKALPAAIKALAKPGCGHHGGSGACLLDCLLTLAQLARHAEAVALAKRFVAELTPEAHAVLAMSYVALNRPAEARKAMVKAKPSERPVLQHARAVMFALANKPKEARAAVARAKKAGYTELAWLARDPNLAVLRGRKKR